MTFDLKNMGTIYNVSKVFKDQIDCNMYVYVIDMLVKSKEEADHITNLGETFNNIFLHRMKLNPGKCTFSIMVEKFLDFMVTWHGLEVNLEKIQVIIDMRHPTSKKEVQ